jgi:hypothetical protein
MLPQVDNNRVAEALSYLTGQFSSDLRTPNVRNLLRVKARRKQDLENTFWSVINSQLLALPPALGGPSGQALNQLGALVGEPRGNFNDVQFLLFIRVIVAARRSGGRTEDLNKIMAIALGLAAFQLNEYYPGRVDLFAAAIATDIYAQPLAQALRIARPPGVFVELTYWDAPNYVLPIFVLGDSVSNSGGTGFEDQVSLANPTVPVSSIIC